jgi:hypothetical protein
MTDPAAAGTGTGSASIARSSSAKGGWNRLGVVKKVAAVTVETMDEPLSLCQYRLRRTPTHAHEYGQNDSSQTTHPQRHPRPRTLEICQPRFNHAFSSSSTDLYLPSLFSQSPQLSLSASSPQNQKTALSPPQFVIGPVILIEPYAIYLIAMPSLTGVPSGGCLSNRRWVYLPI